MSSHRYLGRRDLLVVCWHHIPELVGLLSPAGQWELHRFYAPSHDLSDDLFLAHMKWVVDREPSLAQRVGKHYKLIFRTFKHYADQVGKTDWEEIRRRVVRDYAARSADPTQRRSVVIQSLVEPDLDPLRIGRIFMAIAERQRRDEAA